jgi:biopolymer transport protein ExbB
MFELLQVVDSTTSVVSKGPDNVLELLTKGGWIMIPLGLMLLIAIYVFFERYIAIKQASRIDGNFMNIIRDHIVSGNVVAARTFAKNTNNPVGRIIDKGIQRVGKPIDIIETSMDNVAVLEMYKLEKNLAILSVISKAAPIFGFVGTLIGLMQLFSGIQHGGGEVKIDVIAQGIYTKLITSITGLVIGLFAYFAWSFLNTQIDKATNKMEASAFDFLDVLQEPTR